ncbi:MAG: bifunctional phosphopantothenoylcysteine decarboxylase/phosphopantothenate--cysteine ligase CoaBC [Candidatus Helarchaeota archaeon]
MTMQKRHPSKDIMDPKGLLAGKKICICVTGSVAIIQTVYIIRELMRLGAETYVVMSKAAQQLMNPNLLHWASGNPVVTELTGSVEHVALAGDVLDNVDLLLICPATANTISKIACGIDDTPVTTVVTTGFGAKIPIVIVPAMHYSMYNHPIVKKNILTLKELGVTFLGPRIEENKAKIAHVNEIVNDVMKIIKNVPKRDLVGRKILITAGPTREYIDGVRFITNPSSGRMGIAIAQEAVLRGADLVTIVYGKGTVEPPAYENVKVINIESTEQLINEVIRELKETKYDAFVCAAAIADYTPEEHHTGTKIRSKQPGGLTLKLRTTPKCVSEARITDPDVYICAFKAEFNVTEKEMIDKAYKGMIKYNLNLMVANDVGKEKRGFVNETNEIYIINPDKTYKHIPLEQKALVASEIIDKIVEDLQGKKAPAVTT